MLTHFYSNGKFLILLCLWCHNYWQDFPAALLQVWRFKYQSWFLMILANDNYHHLLGHFDNPLDIFVEGPGGARRCCVPYMQGHVPAHCHHDEWCSKYDNDDMTWWQSTRYTLWCRRCSDPTCNAVNVSRLWFGLLDSGRDSLLSAERRCFLIYETKIVRFPPGKQWWSAPRVPSPCCASQELVLCPKLCRCLPLHCKTAPLHSSGSKGCLPVFYIEYSIYIYFFSAELVLYSAPGTRSACPCTWRPTCPASWSPPRPPPAALCLASSPTLSGQHSRRAPLVTAFEGRLQLSLRSDSPTIKSQWILVFRSLIFKECQCAMIW